MRFPAAVWKGPIPNRTEGGLRRPILGLVLHIEQGSETGTDAWFHNPAAQVSAHFGNPKTGPLDQWVDTTDLAWAQGAGNTRWVSIENEGHAGDELTDSQLSNVALLLAWLHKTEGVPLEITNDVNGAGLGWHGMGGDAWGGHTGCPGVPIVNQRAEIIRRAVALTDAPPPPPRPPVVTAFPGDSMNHFDIHVEGTNPQGRPVGLDDQGHGSTLVDTPAGTVITAYPNTAGYVDVPAFVGAQDDDGKARIIWKGPPNYPPFDAHVWTTG